MNLQQKNQRPKIWDFKKYPMLALKIDLSSKSYEKCAKTEIQNSSLTDTSLSA